ncbi:cryptochrome/photolyase family protein [Maritalea mediterranea]|uniref:Cryptochrome/photolyase family protein n=1 Tax=Maritalea mediterranea TaxID=2909667 RepID=A0ABS9E827_9HYPH|nr:cryptochrome/photolyase family protein [Maritalea mediterranea]MCF4098334.1 cryptochrome/photolyase family protein [Maritalea mediterranea]
MRNLILILGDQLSRDLSSLRDFDPSQDHILMCEVWEEATYVKHHKKKIAFLFSAMRHFAQELEAEGLPLTYTKLDDPDNSGTFSGEVERAIKRLSPQKLVVTFPGEYRVLQEIESWSTRFDVSVDIREDDRFFVTPDEFADWAKGRKSLRMEYFYRQVRQDHNILMDGDKPEGGKWNYDQDNRKPPEKEMDVPAPYRGQVDDITKDCLDVVADRFDDHFGDLEPFYFAVTRDQALYALDKFFAERFGQFGDYQDAMVQGEPWMFHSHISFYLNCGLLHPREVVKRAEIAYYDGDVPLNAVEGFIRQILGWREYVRGIYWLKMPDYAEENALNATRDLPWFFWTGETHMNCLRQCILETKQNAYAHHIQRLMVLGNFALLAGLDPKQVNEWYLIVYADAYEWVELPNVTGMILYADGGELASKPYAAGGAYIKRMSNYCENCSYKVSQKNGPKACPFNYLYWDFFLRNKDQLKGNPRLNNAYGTLNRMKDEKIEAIRHDAQRFFSTLDD